MILELYNMRVNAVVLKSLQTEFSIFLHAGSHQLTTIMEPINHSHKS